MIFFLTLLSLPFIARTLVYNLFRRDLYHAQGERKLKRGAADNLVKRHRRALSIHFGFFLSTIFLSLLLFGTLSIPIIIVSAIVFLEHVSGFRSFGKALTRVRTTDEADTSRLEDMQSDEQVYLQADEDTHVKQEMR